MAITKDDLRNLLAAGYTIQQLTQLSRSDPGQLQNLVNRAGGRGFLPKPEFSRNPFPGNSAPLPQSSPSASLGSAVRGSALGQLFSKFGSSGSGIANKIINPAAAVAKGVLGQSAAGVGARAVGKMNRPMTDFLNDGGDPSLNFPEFNAPELTYRDFTGQAKDQVSGIYAPRYAAIDQAARNAQGNYQRSDQITSGLYQNLAKNIADIAARSAAQYKDAQATQAANTQGLVNAQGQNYSSAQNQEAQLLQQLGQGEAAQQVLGDNSAEQAYQQSQAQAEGNRQGAALANNNQSAQDYYSNMNNANQTGGVAARQDLIAQLGNTLQGYDRDRMNLQGDQSQAALALAQQLSDRDFQAQQANYGVYKDQYGAQTDQQKFAYEQAMARQQALSQQSEIARNQSNIDRDFELQQQKYGTDLATALAQQRLDEQKLTGSQAGGLQFDNQDPVSKTVQQISSAAGGDTGKAAQYYDFVRQATASFAANGVDAAPLVGNQFAFVQQIAQEARNKGLDPLVAQAAAASYWQNILGKKQ